jgi:hypothetical protein
MSVSSSGTGVRHVVGLARADERQEPHFLGEDLRPPFVDAVDARRFLGQQRFGHAHVVPRLGQRVGDRDQPGVPARHTIAERRQRPLGGRNRIAIQLDTPFELPHQRDSVVRQVGAVGEVGALVGGCLGGARNRPRSHRRRQQLSEPAAVRDEGRKR